MDKKTKKAINKALAAKAFNPKKDKIEDFLSGDLKKVYESWIERADATQTSNNEVASKRLQKKSNNFCFKLGGKCLAELKYKGLKFKDEAALPIIGKFEKQWFSKMSVMHINPTQEAKDHFVNILLSYQESIDKAAKHTTNSQKIFSFNKANFNKATKAELLELAQQMEIEGADSMLKEVLKQEIMEYPYLELI